MKIVVERSVGLVFWNCGETMSVEFQSFDMVCSNEVWFSNLVVKEALPFFNLQDFGPQKNPPKDDIKKKKNACRHCVVWGMVIANSSGCSSVWGGSYGLSPFKKNRHGQGPGRVHSCGEMILGVSSFQGLFFFVKVKVFSTRFLGV